MRTITAHSDIDRLFAGKRRVQSPALLVLAAKTPETRDQRGRVLFVAGKRLGGAVRRNRSKRLLREMVRRAGGPWPGWDVALVARAATAEAGIETLDSALETAVRSLGVLQ